MSRKKIDWNNCPNFEFYVIRWDSNKDEGVMWNVFNNVEVYESAFELTGRHIRNKKKYPREAYEKDLLNTIMWQEWSRYEYEIAVGRPFEDDMSKLEKWDSFDQAVPNIEFIADMCIKRYNAWKKAKKNADKTE